MKKIIFSIVLFVSCLAGASESAVVEQLRSSFENARVPKLPDLRLGRVWECRSIYIPNNRYRQARVAFLHYDGLIQVSSQISSAYGESRGEWGEISGFPQFAGTMASMTRADELVAQIFNLTVRPYETPHTLDVTHAYRITKRGDLIIEYSSRVVTGYFSDTNQLLPSLVLGNFLATEYWICPSK